MRPHAIVLGLGVNGLTVARALARRGVTVHGVSFLAGEPGRGSRCCRLIDISHVDWTEEMFVGWLAALGRAVGNRPVVFPTSDLHALWLARHRPELGGVLRFWDTDGDQLEAILRKDSLDRLAAAAGLRSPPMLFQPTARKLRAWCAANAGPYVLKPRFAESPDNPLGGMKIRVCDDEAALAEAVDEVGDEGVLVQRMLHGGDDWQYSVAGLCDRRGRIVTMATKRKIVQYPPDSGITAHGVIPATIDAGEEARLFDAARALLGSMRYDGLFGLEFLKERETGELYLVDFNPRSLYTTSHYVACGLDFPYLAYRLLCGDDLGTHPGTPSLGETYWADLWGCAGAWSRLRGTKRLGFGRLLAILLRSRAHAVWSWRDPWPSVRHGWRKFTDLFRKTRKKKRRRGQVPRPIVKG